MNAFMPTSQAAAPNTRVELKTATVPLVKMRLARVKGLSLIHTGHLNELSKSVFTSSIPSVNFCEHAMKHILT